MAQKMTTIAKLWKLAAANNEPLLGIPSTTSAFDFMTDYNAHYMDFDMNFAQTRGFFAPLWNRQYEETDAEVLDMFQLSVNAYLRKNAENLQRMWDALEAEYNPIENYDRNEHWTDEDDGKDTVIDKFAQQQRTNAYGAEHESVAVGQQVNTNAQGARQETTQYGAIHEEDKGGVAGFNSSTYSPKENSVKDANAHSDTVNAVAVTDTLTQGAHTDTSDKNAHTDTLTDAAHDDTHETDYGKSTEHNGRVHGNVGVTTNQQMITSEIEMRQKYNFYDILFGGIITELCTYYDPGQIPFSPYINPGSDEIDGLE